MKQLNELKARIDDNEIQSSIRVPQLLFGNEELLVVYADGNGMTGFGIDDGDTLFISTDREPKSRDVVMAKADGQTFMRQILANEEHGTYILHADGVEKRDDVETAEPEMFGVLTFILKKYAA